MSTDPLPTASAVIDALGGTAAVAKLSERSMQSVTNWRAANRLPADTYLLLQAALKRRRLNAPAALWGIREPVKTDERSERAAS